MSDINAAYIIDDYVDDSTVTMVDEDSDYPVEKSQSSQVADTTRSTAKVGVKFRIDAGENITPDVFAVLNHNFSGGTYDIYHYTADDWATGKTALVTNQSIRSLDMFYRDLSAPSKQYWEFDFSNITSLDAFLEWGRIMVSSDYVQFTDVEDVQHIRALEFKNITNTTLYGVRWVYAAARERERFTLTWAIKPGTTARDELRTLYSAAYGNAIPFIFIPNISETNLYYMALTNEVLTWIDHLSPDPHIQSLYLELLEEVRGRK